MSWTFKINTGTLASPTWTTVNPLTDGGIEKSVDKDYVFSRLKIDGSFRFYGSENTIVKAIARDITEIQCYYSGTLICTGKLNLKTSQDINSNFGTYSVKSTDDQYINIIEKKSEEFNIFENTFGRTCRVNMDYSDLNFQQGALWTDGDSSSNGAAFHTAAGITTYARREKWIKTNIYSSYSSWDIVDSTTVTGWYKIAINWNHSGTPYGSPTAEIITHGSLVTEPVGTKHRGGGITYTVIIRDTVGSETYLLKDFDYYTSFDMTILRYVDYSRVRRLDGTILNIVNQIDSTIKFDTNSFKILDDQAQYSHLLISQISDFNLSVTYTVSLISVDRKLVEKSDAATVAMLSFEKIMNYLRDNYGIFFDLVLSGSDYYFKLVRYNSLTYTSAGSGNDLTTRHGINVTKSSDKYSYQDYEKWYKFVRKNIGRDIDHLGTDMIITAYENTYKNKELVNDLFFTDIHDSVLSVFNEENKYPDSNNQFFLLSGEVYTGLFWVTGILQYADCTPTYSSGDISIVSDNSMSTDGEVYTNFLSNLPGTPLCCIGDKVHIEFTASGDISRFRIYFVMTNLSASPIQEFEKELTYVAGLNSYELLIDQNIGVKGGSCFIRIDVNNALGITYNATFAGLDACYLISDYYIRYQYAGLSGQHKANGAVSQGSVDNTWGDDYKPSTPIVINGVSRGCAVIPLKEFEYVCTDENPESIDAEMYVKTDYSITGRLKAIKTYFSRKLGSIKVLNS